jgi:hypothetical protein
MLGQVGSSPSASRPRGATPTISTPDRSRITGDHAALFRKLWPVWHAASCLPYDLSDLVARRCVWLSCHSMTKHAAQTCRLGTMDALHYGCFATQASPHPVGCLRTYHFSLSSLRSLNTGLCVTLWNRHARRTCSHWGSRFCCRVPGCCSQPEQLCPVQQRVPVCVCVCVCLQKYANHSRSTSEELIYKVLVIAVTEMHKVRVPDSLPALRLRWKSCPPCLWAQAVPRFGYHRPAMRPTATATGGLHGWCRFGHHNKYHITSIIRGVIIMIGSILAIMTIIGIMPAWAGRVPLQSQCA